jgi:hypothetical protein
VQNRRSTVILVNSNKAPPASGFAGAQRGAYNCHHCHHRHVVVTHTRFALCEIFFIRERVARARRRHVVVVIVHYLYVLSGEHKGLYFVGVDYSNNLHLFLENQLVADSFEFVV